MTISVLIATRHRETFLLQALRSVARQTIPLDEVEVIVVHDGKPGTGLPPIPATAPFHRPDWTQQTVKYFEQQHSGRSAAINRAFSESSGDYIVVLDDDDMMAATKLHGLMTVSLRMGGIVYGLPQYVDVLGKPIETPPNAMDFMGDHPIATWSQFMQDSQWCVHGTACLYPRQVWLDAGMWDERLEGCEEYEYNLRLLHRGAIFYGVPTVTDFYRIHGNQKSGRKARRTAKRLGSREIVRGKIAAWKQGVSCG